MKTAKNKYKHKKEKNFKPKQQTHYIEERKKPDARLKTCSKEVDEMEYLTQMEALQLWFESKTRSSKDEFST